MAKKEATLILKIKDFASAALDEFKDRFVITAGDVVNFAKQMAGAVIDFAKESIAAYREEELALNKLTTAMVNQGVYTQDLKASYAEMASELQKATLYGDEQIINAQAILQSYSKNTAVTRDLTKATLDLAAAKDIDLATAAEAVGKAINGTTDSLLKEKLQISENATEGQRYAAVLDHINSKHRNQAESAASGLGAVDQMKNAWSDFMETVGRLLAPFVTKMAQATTEALRFFTALAGKDVNTMKLSEIDEKIASIRKQIAIMERGGIKLGDTSGIKQELAELEAAREKMLSNEKLAAEQSVQIEKTKREEKRTLAAEQDLLDLEREISQIGMSEEQKLAAQIAADTQKIANAQSTSDKLAAIKEKEANLNKLRDIKMKEESLKNEQAWQNAKVNIISASANLITALSAEGSKAAFLAQKAAAFAQAYVAMNLAAAQALAVPPAPNVALAGAAKAAGMINIAAIAATTVKGLAEGGIVKARPGGMPAIIGEGGQDEAVIPLDKAGDMGFGGGVTINFNGPIMGNESQAQEFAIAIDRQLLKLRQSNQSVAFDSGVI